MKKFLIWLGCLIAFIVPVISVKADDVSYRIPSYKGHLSISDNSSATFTQEITYDFESDIMGSMSHWVVQSQFQMVFTLVVIQR